MYLFITFAEYLVRGSNNLLGNSRFLAPQFVRISDRDELNDVMILMTDYWHMMEPVKPSLCISVIGGAKNFALEGRRKDVFNTVILHIIFPNITHRATYFLLHCPVVFELDSNTNSTWVKI